MRLVFPLTLMAWLVTPALAQQCAVQPTGLGKPVPMEADTLPAGSHDALKRVVASGAQILQVAPVHGYESGVAHTGQQLFVYYTPSDHAALLGGTIIPVPYDTLHRLAGDRVHDLAPYRGIRGMFVQNGTRFQVIYDTPDHQAAIAGSLWDADGKDVTRSQIKSVPGAVPTIAIDTPETREATKVALSSLHGGAIGQTGAPEATMLIDPQCVYSIKSIHALMPAVQAGRLRLKIVPLSLLDYEDRGESTQYAKSMLSFPESEMASAWINNRLNIRVDRPSDDATVQLAQNSNLARQIGLKGTPTFLWTTARGTVGRYEGNPQDIDGFIRSLTQ
ncbi:thiol:disulfide interchange protein [Kozakia baliensis]|nr:thiol:disulfide interchange protein [Kozakia baliensis]GEL65730.1 hypothetical protein KBA01_30160 [Kozakia baliensis]